MNREFYSLSDYINEYMEDIDSFESDYINEILESISEDNTIEE